MKKIFMFIALALVVGCGGNTQTNEEQGVTISGDLTGMEGVLPGDNISVLVMGEDEPAGETTLNEDFTFTLKTNIDKVQFASFMINDEPMAAVFPDGNDITVSYDIEAGEINFEGSELYDECVVAMGDFIAIFESEDATEADLTNYIDNYVVANPSSAVSVYLLQYYTMFGGNEARFATLVDMIEGDFDHIYLYQEQKSHVANAANTIIGADLIDITLPDANGQHISVAELCASGKWVLVDFWATWCGPCRGEIPYLVEAYAEFAPKGLEIYGVTFDENGNEQRWMDFVEQNNMTWVNVWGTDAEGGWSVASHLNVNAIPANFLYSPEGKLVAKNLRGEDVMRILSEHIQ